MKNLFFLFSVSSLLLLLPSCRKETTSRDYTALNKLAEPFVMQELDSVKTFALYNIVNDERTLFLNRFEQDYPGMKTQMDADAKIISETDDSATRASYMQNFNQSYYTPVSNTWNNVGISVSSLTAKYVSVLGDIPFIVGEFGTLTMVQHAEPIDEPPVFADDTEVVYSGTPNFWDQRGCGPNGGSLSQTSFNTRVRTGAVAFTGCTNTAYSGASISLPNQVYKYLLTTFSFQYSYLECTAWALAGGGSASASVACNVEANGVRLTDRDAISISVIAPIIWYASHKEDIPFNTELKVAMRNDEGISSNSIQGILTMRNGVIAGGAIAGSISLSVINKQQTKFRMIK